LAGAVWIHPDIPAAAASLIDADLLHLLDEDTVEGRKLLASGGGMLGGAALLGVAAVGGGAAGAGTTGLTVVALGFVECALMAAGCWAGWSGVGRARRRAIRRELRRLDLEQWVTPLWDLPRWKDTDRSMATLANTTRFSEPLPVELSDVLTSWNTLITTLTTRGASDGVLASVLTSRTNATDEYLTAYTAGVSDGELATLTKDLLVEPASLRKNLNVVPELTGASTPAIDASAARLRLENIRTAYGTYLSDPLEVLTHPALNDLDQRPTRDFVAAYAAATDLAAASDTDPLILVDAIAEAEAAWQQAWANAQKQQDTFLPLEQQNKVRKAHALLARALNPGASPQERESSYRKARDMLQGVVILPRQAVAAVERPLRQLEQ
jgi:hypothetical protein